MNHQIKRLISIIKNKQVLNFIKNRINRPNVNDEDIIISSQTKYSHIKTINNKDNKCITFLIPEFGIGSGGHTTIFRIASFLQKNGYKINFVLIGNKSFGDIEYFKYFVKEYYFPFEFKVFLSIQDYLKETIPTNEILICTSWTTAYFLNKFPDSIKNKFYLIQDYEAQFNPISSAYYFAENTYKFPFIKICASKWLADTIKDKFNTKTEYFNLGYDEKFYYPQNLDRDKNSIIYYGRWETPRRGFEIAIKAFQIVKNTLPDVNIKIYGSTDLADKVPFNFTNLGQLSPTQLAKEFNQSTIGLSISLTNISLTPLEMLACKLPTIEINHPSVANMFKDENEIILSEPDPIKIAQKIIDLLQDNKKQQKIVENGYKKVATEYQWQKAFEKIQKNIEDNTLKS
jgi:O-antigen biosynthesis protein